MIWNEIVCLGDSITSGARDEYRRSYPDELGKILTEKTGEFYYCHNYGVCGETSSDLLRRAWSNITSHDSKILLVMIGTNDTQQGIPHRVYLDNLRQVVGIGNLSGMNVIVATLPQLHFTPLYLKNKQLIDDYNKCIVRSSSILKYTVCDMSGVEKYYVDGVHFTNKGNVEIASRFKKSIMELGV